MDPLTARQGGFTYLTIIMGGLLVLTGALVFGLRFLVKATGGVPADAACAHQQMASTGADVDADGLPASPVQSSGSSGGVNSVCVVLGRDSTPGMGSPKAAGAV